MKFHSDKLIARLSIGRSYAFGFLSQRGSRITMYNFMDFEFRYAQRARLHTETEKPVSIAIYFI